MNKVIFSDLDGTLLDATTYSFDSALPALQLAERQGVPVVFLSGKTRAEVEVWRSRLQNVHPFVVENGGGIYLPKGYFPFTIRSAVERDNNLLLSLGSPYVTIRRKFEELRDRSGVDVRGFGDMAPEEVSVLTGLSLPEASLAKARDFTEPFLFPRGPDPRFLQLIEGEHLRWTQGQFFHLMGNHHRGRAVDVLRSLYSRPSNSKVFVIGIGDSLNDLPFLLAADQPVLIKKKNGKYDARIEIPGLLRTQHTGPAGWNEAVEQLLKR